MELIIIFFRYHSQYAEEDFEKLIRDCSSALDCKRLNYTDIGGFL